MKTRILPLLLCLLLTVPALAAEPSAPPRSGQYAGQFYDVPAGSVFYENAAALYEYGLSVGRSDGTFGPGEPMSVGQAVIFAGRARSLCLLGDPEAGAAAFRSAGGAAYRPYLLYLQSEGALGTELDGTYAAPATRAQAAHVFANALPQASLPLRNDELVTQGYASRRYIADVTEYTPYYQDILFLYRAGLAAGSDARGTFHPEQTITRGAAAAMVTRLADPALRISLTWSLTPDYVPAAGTSMQDLVAKAAPIAAPATAEEMDQAIRSMLSSGENTLHLQYGPLTADKAQAVMELSLATVKRYCEQCYNAVSCTYTSAGALTLTFTAASAGDQLPVYRAETMAAACAVHDQLWEEGFLTADMTDLEKARVYYTWICDNCVYDDTAGDDPKSLLPCRPAEKEAFSQPTSQR